MDDVVHDFMYGPQQASNKPIAVVEMTGWGTRTMACLSVPLALWSPFLLWFPVGCGRHDPERLLHGPPGSAGCLCKPRYLRHQLHFFAPCRQSVPSPTFSPRPSLSLTDLNIKIYSKRRIARPVNSNTGGGCNAPSWFGETPWDWFSHGCQIDHINKH